MGRLPDVDSRERELNQNEVSFFFKDDWKVSSRSDPQSGYALGLLRCAVGFQRFDPVPDGGGNALFGYSGARFRRLDATGARGELTQLIIRRARFPES